ncbi:MAG: nucleotide exchange factor GrpE [Deltaproteobacteria bacterium]|nr:nucleotide exchange factor GrpE [Deltaproteobacteria bacterium]
MTKPKHHQEEQPEGAAPEAPVSPEAAAAARLPSEMAQLQQQLAEKTKEAQENLDRALRFAAEMENLKKRLEREKAELLQFANENLIKELLPVVDNLELALEHGRQAETPAPFLEGIELVHQGFLKALARFGVTPLVAVGQPFDPAYHNAVMQEAAPEVPDCNVLKELQKGYLMHSRLLRPAMVVVARNNQETGCQHDSTAQEER